MKSLYFIILFFLLLNIFKSNAETKSISFANTLNDTLNLQQYKYKIDKERERSLHLLSSKIFYSRPYQVLYTSIPLFIAGSIIYNHEKEFRNMRNTYIPRFEYSYDDYMQYVPMILMYGLKIGGVKSRNSWGRMMTSDALSAAIMATLVNGLKYTVKKERPDYSTRNSFPSGHTATAFMAATMLHKEYGLTQSPIYSIAGYTLATATGISRQLNNRHWMSDVLVGAGIGIVSTELGYWLGDLIFKQKGIKKNYLPQKTDYMTEKPSHFGLTIGYCLNKFTFGNKNDLIFKNILGVSTAIEGAWFFNPHWGIGANIGVSQSTNYLDNQHLLEMHPTLSKNTVFENIIVSLGEIGIGGYYSLPLPYGLLLMANTNLEMGNLKQEKLHMYTYDEKQKRLKTEYFRQSKTFVPGFKTRLHLIHMFNSSLGIGFFAEYKYKYLNLKTYIKENLEDWSDTQFYPHHDRKSLNLWFIGGSVSAHL